MKNRENYTIASEKGEDLRNDHKAAKDIHQAFSTLIQKYLRLGEQQKFKTMAKNMVTLINRNLVIELDPIGSCGSCGEHLTTKNEQWQFCPVCGQRFRDTCTKQNPMSAKVNEKNQTKLISWPKIKKQTQSTFKLRPQKKC